MNPIRLGLLALLPAVAVGCGIIGAPERASDTQNLNAISDDIAALSMTRSQVMHADDPMVHTVLPNHDELPRD
jgi:hypothetical protein